jgi:hypothetical protein
MHCTVQASGYWGTLHRLEKEKISEAVAKVVDILEFSFDANE